MVKNKLTPLGLWLNYYRLKNNITLSSMAWTLDVSASYLSAVERGRKKMFSEQAAEVIADGLGLDAAQREAMLHARHESVTTFEVLGDTITGTLIREMIFRRDTITPEQVCKIQAILAGKDTKPVIDWARIQTGTLQGTSLGDFSKLQTRST